MAVQPPVPDYNANSYLTYTSVTPVDVSNLASAVNPVDVQPVGKVGGLEDSHLLCVPNHSSISGPSDAVLQVKAWLEKQDGVQEVEFMQPKKRVKRGLEDL